ncbi:MAG: UDP-N-acetylmuramate dehydrogenase [Chitinophagales bacterium]|nr:UDP-N-acetylmuramate dehydrogenase [Chitinophagales bacterium]
MIQENFSLRALNTFGIEAHARFYAPFYKVEGLLELLNFVRANRLPLLVLGGGSNVLFTKDFDGVVLHNRISGKRIVQEEDEWVWIEAAAGENWHELVMWTIDHELGGLENLSLIPGYAGAAPIQNIGAYGVELKEVFHSLEAVEISTGKIFSFTAAECRFGYRDSVFKREGRNQFIITNITLRLQNMRCGKPYHYRVEYGDIAKQLEVMGVQQLSPRAVSEAIIAIRRSKLPDPSELGNAGSFFKNPLVSAAHYAQIVAEYGQTPHYPAEDGKVKIPAAWLIEKCGWKGKRVGNTGSHSRQALVLVNYGGATGKEIWECALQIQQSVKEKFGIALEPEVNVY